MTALRTCTAIALLTAALAGCGSSHKRSHTTKTSGSTTTTSASPDKGIVTVDVVIHRATPEHWRWTIYDLRRAGPFLVLDFGVICEEPPNVGCDTHYTFSQSGGSESEMLASLNEPSGVSLIDPAANKRYFPVRDAQLRPDASKLPFQSIQDNALHLAWVKFPAPPASTTALDVVFPNGGPQVPEVPISTGPGPSPASVGAGVQAAPAGPFAQPPASTSTSGLTLPVENLVLSDGNPAGSDAESATHATITLRSDVLFHFDKSSLTPAAQATLKQVATRIKARATGAVQVTGYTDSIGTDQVNIPLSRARAAAVVSALGPLSPGVIYHSAGDGSADPVAPNTKPNGADNPAGRALNRRVTISFAVKSPAPPTPPASSPSPNQSPTTSSQSVTYSAQGNRDTGQPHATWQVTITGLSREGNLAVLKLNLACEHDPSGSCNGATDFIGSESVPPVTFGQNFLAQGFNFFFYLSGIYLIDPATGTEYIPLHDTNGTPLTGPLSNSMAVGDPYPLWLYFPAPPASASTLTVALPGGSPRISVPITAATSSG